MILIFLPQPNGHMNGDQIHMIQQNGKGCHIMKYDITCLQIDYRFIRTDRIDFIDMGWEYPWPNVAIPLVQNTWNYFDVTLTDTWTSFFLRSSLQSPGRWTTAGEVFPVRQLGQLEINFDKNESLSGELQDAIKRLSTGIPRSSTTYSMNYRPIIKVTRNLITSIINRGHPSYTY